MNDIDPKLHRGLQDYCEFYEKLNLRSVRLIEKLAEPGMHFKDPFNDVMGVDQVQKIFKHMFENTQNAKFKVIDSAWGDKERTAYIRWNFGYEMKGRKYFVEGMSEVMFSRDAKVMSHIDYWDAGEYFYEHIPLLGRALRFVKSKLKVD